MRNDPVRKRESLTALGLAVLASFELDSIPRFRSIAISAVLASMAALPAAVGIGEDRPFNWNLEFAAKFVWR